MMKYPNKPSGGAGSSSEFQPNLAEGACAEERARAGFVSGDERLAGTGESPSPLSTEPVAGDLLSTAEHRYFLAAQEAIRARTTFLANVSHELRTPMNAIIGMTDLALYEDLSPVVRDYLETVRGSADQLLRLLNEILDFSKIEAGRFDLELAPFQPREVIDRTVRTLATQAYDKGLELLYDIADDVPDWVLGDAGRLQQVLTNLLSNAIKFTERGEVAVDARLEAAAPDEWTVRFTVSDTGQGIDRDDLQRIFEPFTQVDASTTRAFTGTGLGLTIARELITKMGGSAWVESERGKGSRFYFTARFAGHALARDDERPPKGAQELRGLPVLVIDDNATNRRILGELVSRWKMEPQVAAGGEEGLKLLREAAQAGKPFRLVLLDALMPGMDGFTVAEEIAADPHLVKATVLMLSSVDRQTFADRCDELPVAMFLEKPISQFELRTALVSIVRGEDLADEELSAPSAVDFSRPAARPLRILVAEDTPANQKLIQQILTRRGHEVATAVNGRLAIEALEENEFDVILMDVQMPVMDGMQATRYIRQQEHGRGVRVPIVALTAHAMRGDREQCLAAGMDAYVAKPIDVTKLIELVEALGGWATLHRKSRRASPSGPNRGASLADPASSARVGEGETPPTPPGAPQKTAPPAFTLFNPIMALQRLGDNFELLADLHEFFSEDAPLLVNSLAAALNDGDSDTAYRAAHSLKGLAANLDADAVATLAKRLEEHIRQGEMLDAKLLLPSTEATVRETVSEIGRYIAARRE